MNAGLRDSQPYPAVAINVHCRLFETDTEPTFTVPSLRLAIVYLQIATSQIHITPQQRMKSTPGTSLFAGPTPHLTPALLIMIIRRLRISYVS